uniref:L1 transposable element RRM domain-containing protein n=1 Tax=Sus scrofa TaxID=9823 RepID=A0A4X1SX01_PIG
MVFCISAVTVVTSPFSFIILVIWVLSLLFLVSLARGLSILFTFSKNQLLVLLIFSIVFRVSILLMSSLIFLEHSFAEIQTELRAVKTRMNNAEEQISDMEDRIMEITQTGQQIENQMKKQESNIRDLWDNIKWANLCIIGIPEGVEKDKGMENIFEEINAGNFPNLKDTDFKIQEAQRAPNKLNPKRPAPRDIIIKMAKVKDKERILKAAREKQNVNYKGTPIRL